MRRFFALLLLCVAVVSLRAAATVKVGVLLPLKEQTARGTTMVEFYRGLLMAVDAVKVEGTNVEVTAIDCGSSETSLCQALQTPALQQLDVLFGPVDAVQVTTLSEFCRQHGIRMVLPFNTPCPQVYSNPWVYQVGVAQELLYPGISNLVMEHLANSNFVMMHTGETDSRAQSFVEHLGQVLELRGMQTTHLNVNADEFAYDRALNQFRNNVVVPDSRSQAALTQMLTGLKAYQQKYPQYKVTLLGYPEWLTYTRSLLKDFYQYDTHVFSAYYRNPLSGRVARFEQTYQAHYGQASRVSYPRAEMLGYDLAYYFLHGIAALGTAFEEQQSTLAQQPLQHTFRFQRVGGSEGGFVNLNVLMVHYTPNNTIQLEK
ncbi:MAG: ABC transporter substrate-binding protein [Bacteroidaceae bacterium]|nr:ABC transporter substrate-binding protein [Bacteroidaceae bacterium]